MTCLVLIITPALILLAADNAVTLDERIYGEAQKIFKLSNDPPLAIMIYNSSDFCGIPLENIISEFSKKLISVKQIPYLKLKLISLNTFIKP